MAEPGKASVERDFSKVILTLENVLIPVEKLSPTPSMLDGLDIDTETDLRILGCELIQTAGILLKLPQVAMAAGQLLFQRFFYSKSFVKHNMEITGMACINLASKIEESPRRIRDVINVFHHIKQVKNQKNIYPLILDQNYVNLKNQVIKAERRILKELGFCVHVKHPHKIIVMYLQVLECERNQRLVQLAWNYMNDSFRTSAFVQYHPETIACACIYLAARQIQFPLPNNPPWFSIFSVEEHHIQDVCTMLLKLVRRGKPNPEMLDAIVNDAKQIQIEAKRKARGLNSENATPNSSSRPASPHGVSPCPLSNSALKKLRDEDGHSGGSTDTKENHISRKRSRSHSRSPRAYSNKNRSFSRSRSRSPGKWSKHSKYSPRKYKKGYRRSRSKERSRDYKDKHKHKHRRSRSVSRSRSGSLSPTKNRSKKYKNKVKAYSRSRSRSLERRKPKKSNGHHRSRSREQYRR